jgi:hypothetical protein
MRLEDTLGLVVHIRERGSFKNTTLNIVFSVTNSICLTQYHLQTARAMLSTLNVYLTLLSFLVNHGHYIFPMLQSLSLIKWVFIQISFIHDNISLHDCWDVECNKLCFNIWHEFHHNFSCP